MPTSVWALQLLYVWMLYLLTDFLEEQEWLYGVSWLNIMSCSVLYNSYILEGWKIQFWMTWRSKPVLCNDENVIMYMWYRWLQCCLLSLWQSCRIDFLRKKSLKHYSQSKKLPLSSHCDVHGWLHHEGEGGAKIKIFSTNEMVKLLNMKGTESANSVHVNSCAFLYEETCRVERQQNEGI